VTVVHRQPVTSPLHVEQGFKGQTVTLTLPTAETCGKFCFLVGSAARSKRFMADLTGLPGFPRIFLHMSFLTFTLSQKLRLAWSWIFCTALSLLQWNLARDIRMTLAIKHIHNLPLHLSYVSTLPDITQKPKHGIDKLK